MTKQRSTTENKPITIKNNHGSPSFKVITALMTLAIVGSVVFLYLYKPTQSAPVAPITFEQKMAHLETGAPLPTQHTRPQIPRWMMALILGFITIQIVPLFLASKKARAKELSAQDLRQIEFLTETPLFLGLLGSLLGVCMTHFLSGTLSAPLAYLTTISGILLFLIGRFTIQVSLPTANDFT